MKTLSILLFACLIALFAQPLLPHHAVAKDVAAAHSCCDKEKAPMEKRGCHDDAEKDKGCCGDEGCNPFFTQCPSCAVVALLPRGFEPAGRPAETSALRRYPVFDAAVLSSYLAEMLRPPEVV